MFKTEKDGFWLDHIDPCWLTNFEFFSFEIVSNFAIRYSDFRFIRVRAWRSLFPGGIFFQVLLGRVSFASIVKMEASYD